MSQNAAVGMRGLAVGLFLAGAFGAVVFAAPRDRKPSSDIATAVEMAQEEIQDPFRVRFEAAAIPGALGIEGDKIVLEGVGSGPRGTYALINGERYGVGEEKNGIKMVETRRGEADIWVNGELRTLFLTEELEQGGR